MDRRALRFEPEIHGQSSFSPREPIDTLVDPRESEIAPAGSSAPAGAWSAAAPAPPVDLIASLMEQRVFDRDWNAAHVLATAVLAFRPNDRAARQVALRCEVELEESLTNQLGSLSKMPRLI